jgi:glucan phosphoethanolaminetransferase (alkaline phosphatase superfamily)
LTAIAVGCCHCCHYVTIAILDDCDVGDDLGCSCACYCCCCCYSISAVGFAADALADAVTVIVLVVVAVVADAVLLLQLLLMLLLLILLFLSSAVASFSLEVYPDHQHQFPRLDCKSMIASVVPTCVFMKFIFPFVFTNYLFTRSWHHQIGSSSRSNACCAYNPLASGVVFALDSLAFYLGYDSNPARFFHTTFTLIIFFLSPLFPFLSIR